MAKRKPRDPFEVVLNDEQSEELVRRLSEEVQEAEMARTSIVGDDAQLDRWHFLYEGGDRNIRKDTPWPGAANLTSWIGTEKVDAFRAMVVKTIFAEPIWIVSGWGMPPEAVTFVERFHQWKAEEERLQSYLSKVVHNALIEGTGVLEVSERPVLRKVTQRQRVLTQMNTEGAVIGDPKTGEAVPLVGPDGQPMMAPPDADPQSTTIVTTDQIARTRGGPQYRVLDLKDFFILPGHARDRKDVWGYAKRVWKRLPDLTQAEKLGIYKNVALLGEEDERQITPEMQREGQGLARQDGPTAEKELWELTFLDDLDGDGIQEWYVATFHAEKRVLLRLQKDDLGQSRYLLFIPFPRTKFLYGMSLIGHKLETIIDEHTAWRNMIADRAKLVVTAPIKRLMGSLWNPQAIPWGPGAVIPVKEMNEIEPMTIPDLPTSVVNRENVVLSASERVAGMVDPVAGSMTNEERTLGEVRMVSGQSLIRVEEVVKHLQESLEDLFLIRHEIWKRTLREHQRQPLPPDLQVSLEASGIAKVPQQITADQLEGPYRGKPRGSVETADMGVMRNDFIAFMTALTQISQSIPTIAMLYQDPELAKSLLMQAVRVFRWENPEQIEATIQRAAQRAQMMQAMGQQPGGGPPAPGQAGPNALTKKAGIKTNKPVKPNGRPVDKSS